MIVRCARTHARHDDQIIPARDLPLMQAIDLPQAAADAVAHNGMAAFPYNIIFTSHDHQLTQTVANRIIEITPDGIIDRRCTYDEYMHIAGQEAE